MPPRSQTWSAGRSVSCSPRWAWRCRSPKAGASASSRPGPQGAPREIRAKLYADVATLLKEPAVAELMLKQGMTPAGGTPEELHDLIRSDFERWTRIVREANIRAD